MLLCTNKTLFSLSFFLLYISTSALVQTFRVVMRILGIVKLARFEERPQKYGGFLLAGARRPVTILQVFCLPIPKIAATM